MPDARRVALIVTGGTIDSVGVDRLDLAWYLEAQQRLEPGELLSRVPEINKIADMQLIPFRRLPSQAITPADWIDLAQTIHRILVADQQVDGVVITHGTNTIEETAYFLNLVLQTDRPVVLVGAMRPSSGLSADGELNLLNATRVAADASAAGKGVLVVLNDTIWSARDVTKTASYRVHAFQGRDLGPLGYVDADGQVIFYHLPAKRHTMTSVFDAAGLRDLPRVDVVVSYIGADGAMIDAAVAAGARGIVSAGTGAGRPTPAETEALDRAHRQGVVICQGTRVGSGRTVRSPGLTRRDWVASDNLVPWKAKVLLALALTQTTDPTAIQQLFDSH